MTGVVLACLLLAVAAGWKPAGPRVRTSDRGRLLHLAEGEATIVERPVAYLLVDQGHRSRAVSLESIEGITSWAR